MDLTEILATFAGLAVINVPLVAAIGEAVKLPTRFRALLAAVSGLALAFVFQAAFVDLDLNGAQTVLGGLGVGFGSAGAYSAGAKVLDPFRNRR